MFLLKRCDLRHRKAITHSASIRTTALESDADFRRSMELAAAAMAVAAPVRVKPIVVVTGQRLKGRPVTEVEFERMLEATPVIVGKQSAASWQFALRVLWETGFRIGDLMDFHWDDTHTAAIITGSSVEGTSRSRHCDDW